MQRDQLEALIRLHQDAIYRYLRYLGADRAMAHDLVQETFLATMKAEARRPGDAQHPDWAAWLRGIARNLFLAECRRCRTQARSVASVDHNDAEAYWAKEAGSDEDWMARLGALEECLNALPPRQREAMQERYANRTSREEMARKLGMSEDGVKSLLRRVRLALAQCIEARLAARQPT